MCRKYAQVECDRVKGIQMEEWFYLLLTKIECFVSHRNYGYYGNIDSDGDQFYHLRAKRAL